MIFVATFRDGGLTLSKNYDAPGWFSVMKAIYEDIQGGELLRSFQPSQIEIEYVAIDMEGYQKLVVDPALQKATESFLSAIRQAEVQKCGCDPCQRIKSHT